MLYEMRRMIKCDDVCGSFLCFKGVYGLFCIDIWSYLKRLIPGAEWYIFSCFPLLWNVRRTETEQVDWSCDDSDLSFGGLKLESWPGPGDADWCFFGFLWSQANTRIKPLFIPHLPLLILLTSHYLLSSDRLMLINVDCWHCH